MTQGFPVFAYSLPRLRSFLGFMALWFVVLVMTKGKLKGALKG